MGWLYVRAHDPETRQKVIAALEKDGYKHREEDRITEPVYLIGFNSSEKTYTLVHTITCAAAAAGSRCVIEMPETIPSLKVVNRVKQCYNTGQKSNPESDSKRIRGNRHE